MESQLIRVAASGPQLISHAGLSDPKAPEEVGDPNGEEEEVGEGPISRGCHVDGDWVAPDWLLSPSVEVASAWVR